MEEGRGRRSARRSGCFDSFAFRSSTIQRMSKPNRAAYACRAGRTSSTISSLSLIPVVPLHRSLPLTLPACKSPADPDPNVPARAGQSAAPPHSQYADSSTLASNRIGTPSQEQCEARRQQLLAVLDRQPPHAESGCDLTESINTVSFTEHYPSNELRGLAAVYLLSAKN
jgi:hypothetical protein